MRHNQVTASEAITVAAGAKGGASPPSQSQAPTSNASPPSQPQGNQGAKPAVASPPTQSQGVASPPSQAQGVASPPQASQANQGSRGSVVTPAAVQPGQQQPVNGNAAQNNNNNQNNNAGAQVTVFMLPALEPCTAKALFAGACKASSAACASCILLHHGCVNVYAAACKGDEKALGLSACWYVRRRQTRLWSSRRLHQRRRPANPPRHPPLARALPLPPLPRCCTDPHTTKLQRCSALVGMLHQISCGKSEVHSHVLADTRGSHIQPI